MSEEISDRICDICGKEFVRKNGLQKHKERKTPCKKAVEKASAKPVETKAEAKAQVPAEFREISKKFNAEISKEIRQEQGIFFTPKKARDLLFEKLSELHISPKTILEPSFGSGEFLFDAMKIYPTAKIIGVEKNEDLFNSVKEEKNTAKMSLVCSDFLQWKGSADLIIGNPPYFVFKTGEIDKKSYTSCMTGRPNIYILFLYKCIHEHLTTGGHLAFIIPTSLYNSSYYQPMRDYIYKNTTIKYLETLNKPGFFETGQETMLIILQKSKDARAVAADAAADPYIYKANNGNIYISPFYTELREITKGTETIQSLGLGVKTGNIVWNQVKSKLSTEGTLLIYSSNIKGSVLALNNLKGEEKKQYVKGIDKPTLNGPVILVERGYGNNYTFNAVLVDLKNFYAENHLNVIYALEKHNEKHIQTVLKSFSDPRMSQFIEWFVGNGALSATELETLVPIF